MTSITVAGASTKSSRGSSVRTASSVATADALICTTLFPIVTAGKLASTIANSSPCPISARIVSSWALSNGSIFLSIHFLLWFLHGTFNAENCLFRWHCALPLHFLRLPIPTTEMPWCLIHKMNTPCPGSTSVRDLTIAMGDLLLLLLFEYCLRRPTSERVGRTNTNAKEV